jgi:hypothetical protein
MISVSRCFSLVFLVVIFLLMGQGVALAAKPMDAATARDKVNQLGVGKGLKVTKAGGTTIRGEIIWIGEEGFQLKVKDEPLPVDVSFEQVTGIGSPGLPKGAKIGIAAGVAVALITSVAVALR